MYFKCHVKTLGHITGVALLFAFLSQPSFSQNKVKAKNAQSEIKFDTLDAEEPAKTDEDTKAANESEPASEAEKEEPVNKGKRAATPHNTLPTVDQLVEAKLSALRKKEEELAAALTIAEQKLEQEEANEKSIFDSNAYLEISVNNTAPPLAYELRSTEVRVDGRLVLKGGKRNNGLPRTDDIFNAIEPGCHDIEVKAVYVRLKNDLISRFVTDRVEHVTKHLSITAKNGYRVLVNIEGFEEQNSLVNWKRGPSVRFNRSVRPNFLPGAPIVSMDDVLKQGQLHISYITEDQTHHRLLSKSVSIDGLPILVDEKHDLKSDGTKVFDAPLAQGKHKLNVVLVFAQQKWVEGGPSYNFRLSFD